MYNNLYLSKEEPKDIIEFLTSQRNIQQKDPIYNISRSELKEIKKILYNIEKRKKISSRKTSKYLDELDKKYLTRKIP